MKIVHFADVHLGVENYGRLDPHTGLSTRLTDFLKSIDTIIDTALDQEADLVLFVGDAYKTRDPSPTFQREFARRIQRLSSAGMPTVLVAGNHDVPKTVERAHTLEIYDTLDVENVHVVRSPTVLDIETAHGLVQVSALPWIVRSTFLSRDESRNEDLEALSVLVQNKVEHNLLGPAGKLVTGLTPGIPHILAAHVTVQGAAYGSERNVMLGNDLTLPSDLFKNPVWDYVALGHIHRHQAIEPERQPHIVYPGSIERIGFDEENEDKGFVIATIQGNECSWEFQKLDVRPFLTIRVTADSDDPTAQIVDAIAQMPIDDAVIRLIIRTTAEGDVLIQENKIRRALSGAFYVAAIVHDVVRLENIPLGDRADVASLTPLKALERYLEVKETDPDRIQELTTRAESLLTAQ
jgi:exonuclease SbcD